MKITEQQFKSYEAVRLSGVTNMWDVDLVMELSGLSREQCIFIMKNYTELEQKYE